MSRWLAPILAALSLVLGGCAQDELGLGDLVGADIIFDAPLQSARAPGTPIQVADMGPGCCSGWGKTTVDPATAMVSPTPVPWGPAEVLPAAASSPHDPYRLDTGDRLRISVYGQPSLSRIYSVDQTGNVPFPLIGSVRARGRTAIELGRAIRSRLARDFVRDPFVTVDVAQNRPFFILGEVRLPGQYSFVSGMTVETAVAIAGGYTERASERRFRITRRFNGLVDQIEAPADYALQPGDTVYVFERFF
jgi:polysaccharide export outer membrane protein